MGRECWDLITASHLGSEKHKRKAGGVLSYSLQHAGSRLDCNVFPLYLMCVRHFLVGDANADMSLEHVSAAKVTAESPLPMRL